MPTKSTAILNSYILLDRSGSMQSQWKEAVNSINAYVEELSKGGTEDTVTFAAFDNHVGGLAMHFIDRGTKLKDWRPLTETEITPRGGTPLFDAVGSLVAQINADKPERAVLVIMTDGHENASREYNVTSSKASLDALRAKGYQVLFLGANFDNISQSASLGGSFANTIQASAKGLDSTMRATASSARAYGATGQSMSYSTEDRLRAQTGEANVDLSNINTTSATATSYTKKTERSPKSPT